MKIKSIVSLLTTTIMCVSVVTTSFADIVVSSENFSYKFSERLLNEYGISQEDFADIGKNNNVFNNDKKIPVLIWGINDINHQIVLREALNIIVEDVSDELKELKVNVTEKTTLHDILDFGVEPSAEAIQKYIEKEREVSREMYAELNKEFIKKYMSDSDVTYTSLYSPVIIANISLTEAIALAANDNILELAYSGNEFEDADELDSSTEIAEIKHARNVYGYTGTGVKIGQIDSYAPRPSEYSQLSPIVSNIHIKPNSSTSIATHHATGVASILVGQQTSTLSAGVAPNAELYSTSSSFNGVYDYLGATEWLLTNNVNVINASLRFGFDDRNTYGAYSRWLDHIAKNHFVTVVKSAGNNSPDAPLGTNEGISSGGMAYNIITVGNIDDKNTLNLNDDDLYHTSCYYDARTGLAYKPDICAPGTNIECSGYELYEMTGTSAATPHVAGTVALMFEAKPLLKIYPEVVKAILTATINPDSPHRYCVNDWNLNSSVDSYAKYGSGMLDTFYALKAARNVDFYYGRVASVLNQNVRTIHISSANSKVRVSLAFNINNTVSSSHTTVNDINYDNLQDLDLTVIAPDGTTVWRSDSFKNNVENVEFIAPQAGDYRVKVTKIINSYTEDIEYGVAWMEVD